MSGAGASGDTPHARDGGALLGVERPAQAFLEAMGRGRLHHAWLLTGPQGLGKAGFAYQAARRLLGARPDPASGALASAQADPVSRMVAARSHPDLLVLERLNEGGPARKSIPVDEARRLPEFFSKAPAIAAWRIAIIDSADDLNANAANAVLKTLEEPSGRGVLLLVSHAPGRLLATLRSRCRRLAFQPWPESALARFIKARTGMEEADAVRLAAMAHGAPGRALTLAGQGALALDRQVADILSGFPGADARALLAMAEGFRGAEGAERFALVMERLADGLRAGLARSGTGPEATERWAQAWERLARAPEAAEALNLDRADVFWSSMTELAAAARLHPLSAAPC